MIDPNDDGRETTDEADRTRRLLKSVLRIAGQALVYDLPAVRAPILQLAQELHREAVQSNLPVPGKEAYLEASSRLYAQARRIQATSAHGPTPQTVDKLETDPREVLDAQLSVGQQQAADEIRSVWREMTRKLDAKQCNLDSQGATSYSVWPHPVEMLTGSMERAYWERYRPWAKVLCARRAVPHLKHTQHQVVMSLVLDGLLPPQADVRFRLPGGRAKLLLSESLDSYGRQAFEGSGDHA